MVHRLVSGTLAALLLLSLSHAQEGQLDKSFPKDLSPQAIIQRFAANEKSWKQAREQYSFRQSVSVQALDGNMVVADYQQVADISYNNGKRVKSVVFAPQASAQMSKQDFEDLDSRSSFTISTDELQDYDVVYVGQQKMDDLHCYVFDITPKRMEKGKRYFQGKIWVDDQDFQIVKDTGKSVPDIKIVKKNRIDENLFPEFSTWRQLIDGKFWFPTFSSADDILHFAPGDVHIKQVLKFTNYRRVEAAK